MTQKVLRIGSSAGITLSPTILKALHLKVGSKVNVQISKRLRAVFITLAKNKAPIDLELIDWTENFIDQYGDALRALAKK